MFIVAHCNNEMIKVPAYMVNTVILKKRTNVYWDGMLSMSDIDLSGV